MYWGTCTVLVSLSQIRRWRVTHPLTSLGGRGPRASSRNLPLLFCFLLSSCSSSSSSCSSYSFPSPSAPCTSTSSWRLPSTTTGTRGAAFYALARAEPRRVVVERKETTLSLSVSREGEQIRMHSKGNSIRG